MILDNMPAYLCETADLKLSTVVHNHRGITSNHLRQHKHNYGTLEQSGHLTGYQTSSYINVLHLIQCLTRQMSHFLSFFKIRQ